MREFRATRQTMAQTCGRAVHNLCTTLGLPTEAMHSPRLSIDSGCVENLVFTAANPQVDQQLCTVFQHYQAIIQSVTAALVHIIHNPYIYENNVKKGGY